MTEAEFLPERIREHRARRRRMLRQGYLLGACVLAMGALTYFRQARISQARADLAALEDRAGNLRRQVAMIGTLERQLADLSIKKRIEDELGSRTDCTAVIAELCRLLPQNMALVTLELRTVELRQQKERPSGALPVRSVRAAGRESDSRSVRRFRLVITGLAPTDVDVANFIGQLSASPLFEDVNMGYAKTVEFRGRSAREFQASCYLTR